MKVILVDDERLAIERLKSLFQPYDTIDVVGTFQCPQEALAYIEAKPVDAVLLDINMPKMDGMTLAKAIKERQKEALLIFITGHGQFAVEAFEVAALDYLVKPVRRERFDAMVKRLESQFIKGQEGEVSKAPARLQIQTFSQFLCTYGNERQGWTTLKWRTQKAKELLAYLVAHINEEVSRGRIIDNLWPEFEQSKALNNLNSNLYYLRKMLKPMALDDHLVSDKHMVRFRLNGERMRVDFLDFEKKVTENKALHGWYDLLKIYKGEYLAQEAYLWASSKRVFYETLFEEQTNYWYNSGTYEEGDIGKLNHLLSVYPYVEKYHIMLISLLKKMGREKEAQKSYDTLYQMMVKDYGCPPNLTYKDIHIKCF